MKHIGASDYVIFFDSHQVDGFVIDFRTNLGLTPSDATASITMMNAPSMDKWKAYLTEVRIFLKNVYTGRYRQVFEGDIVGMNDSESRQSTGRIVFSIKGLFSWLDIPVPMYIQNIDNLNTLRRFQLQAQNIDVDALTDLVQTRKDLYNTDKTIEEIITKLFLMLDRGYTEITDNDTAFGFKDLLTRFKVMSDIDPKFRDKGFLDLTTFTQATTLQGFYEYLYQILSQMMLEFYQDIDGTFKIKGPSWNDSIPLGHILDESVVDDVSKGITWDEQPTRILAIGGKNEILESQSSGSPLDGADVAMQIPVGLYINGGKYYGMHFDSFLKDGADAASDGEGGTYVDGWYDDISNKKVYALGTYLNEQYVIQKINGGKEHMGVDYYMSFEPLNNQGIDGTVEECRVITGGGNSITIKQNILGDVYYFTYMHLKDLPSFKKGDAVKAGQRIGTTGDTGVGPAHLHFQVWKNGFDWNNQKALTIDPVPFMKKMKTAVPSGGSFKGKLLGTKDYKGPDRNTNGHTAGIKAKLKTMAQFDAVIGSVCAKNGVNPMMAKVIALMESSGDPNALGDPTKYGQARGLTQIIPSIVGVKVDADKLYEPAYNIEMFCKAIKEKIKMIKKNGLKVTVKNGAHFWYGYLPSGKSYADAFAEIYEGFGLKSSDAITGNFEPKKDGKKKAKTSEVVPRVSGPQMPSLAMAKSLMQSMETSDRVVSAQVVASPGEGGSGGGGTRAGERTYNPYSAGGSFQEGTPDVTFDTSKQVDGKAVSAPNKKHKQKFVLPSGDGGLASIIKANSNGLDINLVWAIIKEVSNMKSKFKKKDDQTKDSETHYGLMGVPKSYMNQMNLSESEMFDPTKNIYYGTKFYKECYAATKKHSFALLVYFLGGGGLSVLEEIKKKAVAANVGYAFVDMLYLMEGDYDRTRSGYYVYDRNAVSFTDVRPPIRRVIMNWTQGVLDNYAALYGGNYIKGDPHRGFRNAISYYAKPANVTIAIDAAAGGKDKGRTANNLNEKDLTLSVATMVKTKIEEAKPGENVTVHLTRYTDAGQTYKQRLSTIKAKKANQVFIITFAKGGKGVTVYTKKNATVGSKTLQEKIGKLIKPVVESNGLKYNGAKTASEGLVMEIGSPSAIEIELGHLDDEKDATVIRGGTYLEEIATAIAGAIVNATNADGNQMAVSSAPAEMTKFPDFFAKYKPQLSDEERKYKMQFTSIEMELIRAGGETGGDLGAAEAYLEQYAKYMMHILRARATGLSVACVHAMPHIRPGFNAWLEPTRKDVVFYVTGVTHMGSFQAGVTTSVTGAYTRKADEYDEKFNNNLFVSVSNFKAKDLVRVVDKKKMDTIRKELKGLHGENKIIGGSADEYLKAMYSVSENPDKSLIQGKWNAEMNETQIRAAVKERYASAPKVVKDRIASSKKALDGAKEVFDEYLKRGSDK